MVFTPAPAGEGARSALPYPVAGYKGRRREMENKMENIKGREGKRMKEIK